MGPFARVQRFFRQALVQVQGRKSQNSLPASVLAGTAVLALSTLNVFSPSGIAQSCPVNTPHIQGVWRTLPYLMPINPISATLLHTGKVLIVAGSENDASNNSKGSESYRNAIWDPADPTANGITGTSDAGPTRMLPHAGGVRGTF